MTTLRRHLVPFVRALGAFQVGVGAYLLLPPQKYPLVGPAAVGVAAFWLGERLYGCDATKHVLAFGYVFPLGALTGVYLLVVSPPDANAAAGHATGYLLAVYAGTPLAVYPACVLYASFAAADSPHRTPYL